MTCTLLEGISLCYLLLGLLVKVRVPGKLSAGACLGTLHQVQRCSLTGSGTICPDNASGQVWDQALLILLQGTGGKEAISVNLVRKSLNLIAGSG